MPGDISVNPGGHGLNRGQKERMNHANLKFIFIVDQAGFRG